MLTAGNDNSHHSPERNSDPHTRILEAAYTLASQSLLHEIHQICRPLYHVPSRRHPRKRNNQRQSLNIKMFRSLQWTSPLTKHQKSRWQYDPLRPLQSSERIAISTPQQVMLLMSTKFHQLWRLTHSSHNAPLALLLGRRNQKLRGLLPETGSRSRTESRLSTELSDTSEST